MDPLVSLEPETFSRWDKFFTVGTVSLSLVLMTTVLHDTESMLAGLAIWLKGI